VFCSILPTTMMSILYLFIIRVNHVQLRLVQTNMYINGRIVQPGTGIVLPRAAGDTRILHTTSLSIDTEVTSEPIPRVFDESGRTNASTPATTTTQIQIHEVKAVRIIIILLFLFVLLTLPYFIITLVVSMGHWEPHAHPYYLHIISVLLFHTNNTCNALFYGYSNRRLRDSLITYLRKKISRQKQTESDIVSSQWLPSNRLSVMGDGSSVGHSQDSSHNSEISTFSAFSREAFISRDILGVLSNNSARNTMAQLSVNDHLITPIC
jgi:hypothetical protein